MKKNKLKRSIKASLWLVLWFEKQKVISKPKTAKLQKKECASQKGQGEKRCEIKGGSQEMAVMVG